MIIKDPTTPRMCHWSILSYINTSFLVLNSRVRVATRRLICGAILNIYQYFLWN